MEHAGKLRRKTWRARVGVSLLATLASWGLVTVAGQGTAHAEFGYIGSIGPVESYYPQGVAVSDGGFVYVLGPTQSIDRFDPSGNYLGRWRIPYPPPGEDSATVWGIAAGATDVYVADRGRDVVQRFTPDGQLVSEWGGFGDDPGEFYGPEAIATDDDGFVYVADSLNARIQKFTADGSLVKVWGDKGRGPGELEFPTAIATDGRDRVYVGDEYDDSVTAYTTDGDFVAEWGEEGEGDGEFVTPREIAADRLGNVYVSDYPEFPRVQRFSPTGEYRGEFGCPGGGPEYFGFFAHGLAITPSGELLYMDDARALVFGEGGQAPECVMDAWDVCCGQEIDELELEVACFTEDCDVAVRAKVVGPRKTVRMRTARQRLTEGVGTWIDIEFRKRSQLREFRRRAEDKGFRKRYSVIAEVSATDASGATEERRLEISLLGGKDAT